MKVFPEQHHIQHREYQGKVHLKWAQGVTLEGMQGAVPHQMMAKGSCCLLTQKLKTQTLHGNTTKLKGKKLLPPLFLLKLALLKELNARIDTGLNSQVLQTNSFQVQGSACSGAQGLFLAAGLERSFLSVLLSRCPHHS